MSMSNSTSSSRYFQKQDNKNNMEVNLELLEGLKQSRDMNELLKRENLKLENDKIQLIEENKQLKQQLLRQKESDSKFIQESQNEISKLKEHITQLNERIAQLTSSQQQQGQVRLEDMFKSFVSVNDSNYLDQDKFMNEGALFERQQSNGEYLSVSKIDGNIRQQYYGEALNRSVGYTKNILQEQQQQQQHQDTQSCGVETMNYFPLQQEKQYKVQQLIEKSDDPIAVKSDSNNKQPKTTFQSLFSQQIEANENGKQSQQQYEEIADIFKNSKVKRQQQQQQQNEQQMFLSQNNQQDDKQFHIHDHLKLDKSYSESSKDLGIAGGQYYPGFYSQRKVIRNQQPFSFLPEQQDGLSKQLCHSQSATTMIQTERSNNKNNNERDKVPQQDEQNEEFFNVGNYSFTSSRSDLLKSKVMTSPPLAKYAENLIQSSNNLQEIQSEYAKKNSMPIESNEILSNSIEKDKNQQISSLGSFKNSLENKQNSQSEGIENPLDTIFNNQNNNNNKYASLSTIISAEERITIGYKFGIENPMEYKNLRQLNENNNTTTFYDLNNDLINAKAENNYLRPSVMNGFDIGRDSWIKQGNQFISNSKVIEHFFVISADQEALNQRIFTENEPQSVPAKKVYVYPQMTPEITVVESTLNLLSFPNGVPICLKAKSGFQKDYLEILKEGKVKSTQDRVFVFTVKTEQSYEKSDNRQNKDANGQTVFKDVTEVVNSSKLLYCICIYQNTFLDYDDSKSPLQGKKKDKKSKKEYFFNTQMAYCILTRLPDIQFSLNIIKDIANLIYYEKKKNITDLNISFSDYGVFSFQTARHIIEPKLNILANSMIPFFEKQLSIQMGKIGDKQISSIQLVMPSLENGEFYESFWGIPEVLKRFQNSGNLVRIYAAILLERSIVFQSESMTLLSQFILFFHSLIKPIKWPHAMIMALPQSLEELLQSPTPIILGMNKPKKYLDEIGFNQKFPDFDIIYIDQMVFSYTADPLQILIMELNEQLSSFQTSVQKPTAQNPELIQQYYLTKQRLGIQLMKVTRDCFLTHIVQYLPKEPIFKEIKPNSTVRVLDYSLISDYIYQQKKFEDGFIDKLFQTQIFLLYLEEYYGVK